MTAALILASTSPYRRELLARLQLDFRTEAPAVDETPRAGEEPPERALRLAREKALTVARQHTAALVIGSDQVCSIDGRLLRKPGTEARARAHLAAASGRRVEFHTAVALSWQSGQELRDFVDHTRVQFRELDASTIAAYVAREQPLDCAGAFRCEGLGIALFESITSEDPTALVGLPLIAVARLLREAGVAVV